ncbi:hypothetical protein QTP86_033835 [Hemibagrus guttatus]|nr:hypothetical protein QTP86_033835 [Hemibagrus guttatus]
MEVQSLDTDSACIFLYNIGDAEHISKATVCRTPTKHKFHRIAGFPNVVGCTDGTHIPIITPPVNEADFQSTGGPSTVLMCRSYLMPHILSQMWRPSALALSFHSFETFMFIHCLPLIRTILGSQGACAYLRCHWASRQDTPWTECQPITGHTHTHSHSLTTDNLEMPINLQCMSLDRGRKPPRHGENMQTPHTHGRGRNQTPNPGGVRQTC